jgi:hypothetical protein
VVEGEEEGVRHLWDAAIRKWQSGDWGLGWRNYTRGIARLGPIAGTEEKKEEERRSKE